MANPSPTRKRKPTFLWQALLIVLPVAVLVVFGFVSLRQDRLLVQREAAERAQTIADELVPRIWAQLTAVTNLPPPPQPTSGEIVRLGRDDTDGPTIYWRKLPRHAIKVDHAGNLIFPPPYSPVPKPHPLNPADLNEQQIQQWTAAEAAESATTGAASAIKLYTEFLASNPPADFAAIASYRLGLLLDQQHKPEAAVDAFAYVLVRDPSAISEAGLPLDAFAKLKLLQLTHSDSNHVRSAWAPSPDDLCSNVICQPSFLTPRLLTEMAGYLPGEKIQKWQSLWDEHEATRALFAGARPFLPLHPARRADEPSQSVDKAGVGETFFSVAPELFWFNTPQAIKLWLTNQTRSATLSPLSEIAERDWLALRVREEIAPGPKAFGMTYQRSISHNGMSDIEITGPAVDLEASYSYLCRGQSEIASELAAFVKEAVHLPDYFGLGLDIAGKRVNIPASDLRIWREVHYNAKGSGERKEVLEQQATTVLASATKTEAGSDLLKVNVYLTSPAMLYKLQTTRTFWFGSLILFSAVAALLGLAAAWRSFQRQLQLSEMKSNFVASVSHELRAPIASVRLMAESLERGKIAEPAKQKEYFRFIGQESRRLSSLIENVLDFSRIEQGRKQYEFEPTDLLALAHQTVKLMEPYAAEREIQLVLTTGDPQLLAAPKANGGGPAINYQLSADGRALQQALVNLLDNAIKHSRSGQTVTIRLDAVISVPSSGFGLEKAEASIQNPASENPPHDTRHVTLVTLSVEDQGTGIPQAEHEKIFERFYRLGSELRRETQGVGIGLSIVKHIVEAHGGRIIVRSAPGQGSHFSIQLPVHPQN